MSTALATTTTSIVRTAPPQLSREQVELIKRTIAKDTTDDELQLFVSTCNRLGLDPFSKQIHCVKRWDNRLKREVMAIQVGIDGFRTVASRTGELDGQDGPWWCGDDGEWRDVWLGKGPPSACKVVVYRRGCSRPFTGVATYRSYVQTNREGNPNAMWSRGADFMLAKCAEAVALRKAFPSDLAGVYAPEELAADDRDDDRPQPAPPGSTFSPATTPAARATRPNTTAPVGDGDAPRELIDNLLSQIEGAPSKADLRTVGAGINGVAMSKKQREELLAAYREQWTLIDEAEKADRGES